MRCPLSLALVAACGSGEEPEPPREDPLRYELAAPLLFDEALAACMDAELADLDADGRLDVALAVEFDDNVVLWNRPDGFEPERLDAPSPGSGAPGGDSEEVVAVDADGDGDLDLVFANEDLGGDDELWLRDGPGWIDASDRLPGGGTSEGIEAADLDGDGTIELVVAEMGPDSVWRLEGGAVADVTATWLPDAVADSTQDVELADLDGDGDLDVAFANEQGDSLVRLQEGGRLVDAAPLPPEAAVEAREVDAADLDGDGDLDLVLGAVGWTGRDPQDVWLENDGRASFTARRLPREDLDTLDVDAVDLDLDGDLDLVRANAQVVGNQLVPAPLVAWENDGTGRFDPFPDPFLPWVEGQGLDVEAGDLDGDGLADLYLCARATRDAVLYARGTPPG